MPLPSPNLDDRSFQDLVDDAKRLVQRRCPEWTDHNVSDPGVTLIETFAYMVDQLLWRLNRVPDRLYTRFLDLIGLQLFPPSPARAPVTFWLSAPQPTVVSVPALTKVQTARSSAETPPISFSTLEQLDIVPCHRSVLGSQLQASGWQDWTDRLRLGRIQAFSSPPEPGDALLVGLSDAVPRCAVALQISCQIEGIGVDPDNPPLVWEAFDGQHWTPCELERDTTGGLNRAGEIVLHVPASHAPALLNGIRAGWLRGRVCQAELDQPSYSHSPFIERLDAATVGGTTGVIQAEIIEDEILGTSDGVPAQTFEVAHRPMVALPGEPTVLEVSDEPEGWQEWTLVDDFARSGPEDRHFTLDPTAGEIRLGPAVRLPEGNVHQHGAVPPKGAVLRLRRYASGGGASGNVARGAISVLQGTIPFIASVENRQSASGGVDGETVEEAKARGPVELRTLRRAVTAEDYELLARLAAPDAARVHAVAAIGPEDAGGVRVLVVPSVADDKGRLDFAALQPDPSTLSAIATYLESRRTIGARVVVEPAAYQGITVVAALRPRPWADPDRLQADALAALYRLLNPLTGGPDGRGWPFGRPVLAGEVYGVLSRLRGCELVDDVRLFAADPVTAERGPATQRVDVAPHALVFSFEHQIRVLEPA